MRAIPWEVDGSTLSDAYVAGFLDGDGSIVATRDLRPERRSFPYRIRLKINFTQSARHLSFLKALQRYLGDIGAIRINKKKHLAELVVQNRKEVAQVLEKLGPHLVLKR